MKLLLALCLLVVYLFAEASARPSPDFLDQARDIMNQAKEKVQGVFDQAQEAAKSAIETARNTIQNGLNTAQQTAQSNFGLAEFFSHNVTTTESVKETPAPA